MMDLRIVIVACLLGTQLSAAWPLDAAAEAEARILHHEAEAGEHVDEVEQTDFAVHSQAEGDLKTEPFLKLPSLLPTPAKTAESVNLEHEAIPSKVYSAYDNSQKKLLDITNPVPIVDTISEHEKYGNNGDMFDGVARALVNGYEAFSNLLNTLIQKPQQLARSLSKGLTTQLDVIGGKLVGL